MGRRVLLVEGLDDQHVMWALFQAHNLPQSFTVEKADGIDKLLESIPVWLKASNMERFAVVLDADENIQQRWDELKGRLVSSGCLGVPVSPVAPGIIIQIPDGPKLGAWIMPNNQVPGMLETFLAFLVPGHDPLLPHVDHSFWQESQMKVVPALRDNFRKPESTLG
jgi:hypothetical protein